MSKVALVTGAASGLGHATATRLLADGYTVVGIDLNAELGEQAFAALGSGAHFVKADVSSEADVSAAIAKAQSLGSLRAAVCCAGVGWASRIVGKENAPHDFAMFRKLIEINLIGTFNVYRLAAAAMVDNELDEQGQRGVLIGTASVAAFEGQIGQVAYSASKGGVAAMTLPIARDLASKRVRCLAIAPGLFNTPMVAGLPEKVQIALGESIPNPSRLGKPSEYADLVSFMVATPYLNGETVRLDGAIRLAPR